MTETQVKPRRGIGAAIALFFIAPLLAEYLLGDLPLTLLVALVVMAPVYGGGALLIRELTRRSGRGWPTMLALGAAYGLVEEAFLTQSLFNPNYLHLNLHLLDHAFLPALGIGAWWTVFVLTLHTAWSIGASIALAEALAPSRCTTPWLGKVGLAVVVLLFAFGLVANFRISQRMDPFMASKAQFAWSGVIAALLIAAAFLLPCVKPAEAAPAGSAPNPWLVGLFALIAGSAVQAVPPALGWGGWGAAGAVLALDLLAIFAVAAWSHRAGWALRHRLALGAGAAMAYAWHSFLGHPVANASLMVTRIGNAIFTLAAIVVIVVAARRTSRAAKTPAEA